jgi:hypothetical protein
VSKGRNDGAHVVVLKVKMGNLQNRYILYLISTTRTRMEKQSRQAQGELEDIMTMYYNYARYGLAAGQVALLSPF